MKVVDKGFLSMTILKYFNILEMHIVKQESLKKQRLCF